MKIIFLCSFHNDCAQDIVEYCIRFEEEENKERSSESLYKIRSAPNRITKLIMKKPSIHDLHDTKSAVWYAGVNVLEFEQLESIKL